MRDRQTDGRPDRSRAFIAVKRSGVTESRDVHWHSASRQRVMCVRACVIGVRLPSPRAVTGYVYINSKTVLQQLLFQSVWFNILSSVLGSISDTCIMIRIMIQKMYQVSSIKIHYCRCISVSITDTLTTYQYHESLIYSCWYFYYCSLLKCKGVSRNYKTEKPNNPLISQRSTY